MVVSGWGDMLTPTRKRWIAAAVGLLGMLAGAPYQLAVAQDLPAVSPSDLGEALPTSRASLAAAAAVSGGALAEDKLRAVGGLSRRATFAVGGEAIALYGSAIELTPRLAFGAAPGVAVLIKLPDTTQGLGADEPELEARYALATVRGTRVDVWAFYNGIPGDGVTGRRALAALARLNRPFLSLDPDAPPFVSSGAVAAEPSRLGSAIR